MRQRFESKLQAESHSAYAAGLEPRLPSDGVDQLLAGQFPEPAGPETETRAAPMDGVWLGAAVGVVLWAVIVGVVLLAWPR